MKKSLLSLLSAMIGMAAGALINSRVSNKTLRQNEKRADKFKTYYEVLVQWLAIKQEGRSIEEYFQKNKFKTIAIYGMGEIGNRLYKELENSSIHVKYCLDKEVVCLGADSGIVGLEDDLQPVDAVIVTAIFAFDEIEEKLSEKMNSPIISFEDVIFSI